MGGVRGRGLGGRRWPREQEQVSAVVQAGLTVGPSPTVPPSLCAEAKLQKRLIEGTLTPEQVDQLSVVAMAGAASEAMKFDDVVGQNAGG